MIKRETKKVYYETDAITQIFCDKCNKEITNEEFFRLDLSYRQKDEEGKYINLVYDINDCHVDMCKECIKDIEFLTVDIEEYINDSLT
jgi:hypothetical protein